jgi:hypothetical protein
MNYRLSACQDWGWINIVSLFLARVVKAITFHPFGFLKVRSEEVKNGKILLKPKFYNA